MALEYIDRPLCLVGCQQGALSSSLVLTLMYHTQFASFLQTSERDVSYFDTEFTNEAPGFSPVDPQAIREINQVEFQGFSFTNSEFLTS